MNGEPKGVKPPSDKGETVRVPPEVPAGDRARAASGAAPESGGAAPGRRVKDPKQGQGNETIDRWANVWISVGVVIFLLNMGCAWWMARAANAAISAATGRAVVTSSAAAATPASSAADMSVVGQAVAKARDGMGANETILLARAIEADAHLKFVTNKQTILVVGMAAGFAFLAIGFSLFVMGIRGAFHFAFGRDDASSIVLRSTSPGVFCFFLGAVVLTVALTREGEVAFGEVSVADGETPAKPPPVADPQPIDYTNLDKLLEQQQAGSSQ
ncbi:hypothetical protein [Sorangium sp. So ce394]|uniref:hypothetical protein n=1 Tax=Sorangium sp. So ce394 TaxID=3133310 RepID=UPI003F5AEDC1